jgi:hypothetical protein
MSNDKSRKSLEYNRTVKRAEATVSRNWVGAYVNGNQMQTVRRRNSPHVC